MELPRSRSAPVVVKRYEIVSKGGVVSPSPPVAVVYLEGAFPKLTAPPVYPSRPILSALELSPDGRWLAVSGYHEVFLFNTESLGLESRLLGESPRIESLAFSPDSRRLAVSGGAPARFGEIQVWTIPDAKLTSSWRVGSDSAFGVSWSPFSRVP